LNSGEEKPEVHEATVQQPIVDIQESQSTEGPNSPEGAGSNVGPDELHVRETEPDPSKMRLWDIIYGILFQPVATLRYAAEQKPVLTSFLVGLVVSIFTGVMNLIVARNYMALTPPATLPPELAATFPQWASSLFVFGGLMGIIFYLVFWFVSTAIFNLLAAFFGGRENGKGLFAAIGLTLIPSAILPPLQVLVYALGAPGAIYTVLSVAVVVWVLILEIISIREANKLSTGLAVVIFFLPLVVVIAVILVMIILLVGALLPFFQSIGGGFPTI